MSMEHVTNEDRVRLNELVGLLARGDDELRRRMRREPDQIIALLRALSNRFIDLSCLPTAPDAGDP